MMRNKTIIGKDLEGTDVILGQRLKRNDGVIGSFRLGRFELVFDYEQEQENGAVCSYNGGEYRYETI